MHKKILKAVFFVFLAFNILSLSIAIKNADPNEKEAMKRDLEHNIKSVWFTTAGHKGFLIKSRIPIYSQIATNFRLSFLFFLAYPLSLISLYLITKEKFSEKKKRGSSLLTDQQLQKILPKNNRLNLSERISIPYGLETRHFFIGGANGTGKTNLISRVIAQLKERNEKAIIYDAKDGEFVARFYNPQTDIIYNPFDERSVYWNIFESIENDSDFDMLAASIVPDADSGKDRFFNDAARNILSGILRYCHTNGRTDNHHVWRVLRLPVNEIYINLLSVDSEAATYLSESQGSTTQSIMSTLIRYAKIFRYLQNTEKKKSFALSKWIDSSGGTIFLTNNTKQRESLRGILSLFINSLANTILSMRDDPERRIFIIIDEFGTLQKMQSIKELLSLGRSKGCSFWLGIQEKAQIDDIYGRSISNSIINQCNTHIIFRMNDSDSADYFSRIFGEKESETMENSYNAGIENYKDGESYRPFTKKDRLVLPSQIQNLPDLNFFIKLHSFAVCQTEIKYKEYEIITDSFTANKTYYFQKQDKVSPKTEVLEVKNNTNGNYFRLINKRQDLENL